MSSLLSPYFGAIGLYFLIWSVLIGSAVLVLRAMQRFVRAQERIASALEKLAAKQ